ncbi:AraC family transcriptional regulator SphR [Streptomyces coacervatus]|uniref:AraC family transcriptional regulator SphR n=1 Tax=Streptomyces coacervatus TaxID=647381 RepID=A0ABP7JMB8_9ACTN|nr:AraC family transcriptional regulator [Streptomyces coacervatus]MDF2264376.1 AraC family transcriptional regulator [Streptomyces coacervatus]
MSLAPDPANSPGTSRSTSATIQPNILWYLVTVADERGIDLRPELEQVGLDETVMRSAALRVSYRQGSAVIRRALELTGDEHLGLKVGAAQHLTAWGLLGFALMADDTLRHAIETGVKYQNLSGAMVVWSAGIGEEDGAFVLRADLPDPATDPAVAVFLIEEGLASVVTLSRLAVGPAFAPRVVEFTCPPPRRGDRRQSDPYGALFGCPVRFGAPANRLVIDPAWARARMPGRDPVTYASTLELLDAQLSSRRDQQDLLEVLEISVAQSLPMIPSFAEQARRHATSERTLRRRLADCGTTYEALVEGVRRERVELLLLRPELTLRDIARRAGFSDERALRRAVRRWHGTSPVHLRERMRADRF